MYVNSQSAAEKVFLYGSLVFLLWSTRFSRWTGTMLGAAIVFVIELLQTLVVGHMPEITDPLLVILAATALSEFSRNYDMPALGQTRIGYAQRFLAGKPPGASMENAVSRNQSRSINLRRNQLEFLQELSDEMDASLSSVVSQIVERFVKSDGTTGLRDVADRDWLAASPGSTRIRNRYQASQIDQRWVSCEIKLDSKSRMALSAVAGDLKLSESRLIRRMIFRLMDD